MALALGESFKQFVAERAVKETDRAIHWDRLPSLLSFLLLIVPFYQGMSRYFYLTYGHVDKMPQPYALFLAFDGLIFMIEAALFFVMSRALPAAQWLRYYACVLILLIVDSIWVWASHYFHSSPIETWMFLNFGFGAVVLVMLLCARKCSAALWISMVGAVIVLLRTGLDYWFNWSVYFP
jgi:hypothetical protein